MKGYIKIISKIEFLILTPHYEPKIKINEIRYTGCVDLSNKIKHISEMKADIKLCGSRLYPSYFKFGQGYHLHSHTEEEETYIDRMSFSDDTIFQQAMCVGKWKS
jgi:hypothetical protein